MNNIEFSIFNKTILSEYAKSIENKINNLGPRQQEIQEKVSTALTSWLPTPRQFGATMGYAMATTHGPAMSNRVIDFVCSRLFVQETGNTWYSIFRRAVLGIAQPTITETAKLAITPKVLPIIQLIGGSLGGLTAAGTIALIMILYGRAMNTSSGKHTPSNPPKLEELLHIEESTGKVFDANGHHLTKQDISDIREIVLRYDTVCKFVDCDQEKLDQLFRSFLLIRTDNLHYYYQDGTSLTESELECTERCYNQLKGTNPLQKAKSIHATIKLLSKHQGTIPMKSTFELAYVSCEDGVICTREGLVVSQEEYLAQKLCYEQEVQALIDDFKFVESSESVQKH